MGLLCTPSPAGSGAWVVRCRTVGGGAATASFLASPGVRHITGQTVHANGGGAFATRQVPV